MIRPKVSIIMATYNRENFIVESLHSIQAQTFVDWECLIIDDGGHDNTKETIAPLLQKDIRFCYFNRTNNYIKGLPGCRNYGLDIAKGDYIIFFDDDDIAHPQNLELCVLELSKGGISFCRYIRNVFINNFNYDFDYSKSYTSFNINKKDIEKILKNELQFNSCAVMWDAKCFNQHRFVETLMYAEEWELYSRIVLNGYEGISINKSLFYGRKHPISNTGEYDRKNPVRKKSYAEAILLVVENLKEKQLLNYSLKCYFIAFSIDFEEFNLFKNILKIMDFSTSEKLKWQIFYKILPLRLKIYKAKKKLLKVIK